MSAFTDSLTLTGRSYAVVNEAPIDSINRLPLASIKPVLDFSYGYRALDGSDTTFTAITVTFASTSVADITNGMVVEIFDQGVRKTGVVQSVSGQVVTTNGWSVNGGSTPDPSPGSRVLISSYGPVFSYTVGVTTYTSGVYKVGTGVPVTFSALAFFPPYSYRQAVDYEWDLGDGTQASGPDITHTYRVPNNNARVTLLVTDSQGDEYAVGKQIYVYSLSQPVVHPGFVLIPS